MVSAHEPLLLSTYIVSENHAQLPDLVLDIDGVQPGKNMLC